MAGLAQAMSIGGLRQAIELDFRGLYGARLEEFDDTFEMPAGASDRRPERSYVIAWRLRRLRPGSDKGCPTARLEHRERALRYVAADGIEDGVAIGDNLSEIRRFVVDDFVGSKAANVVVIGRARGRDHTGADMLGELNGEAGHSACSALDENRLAGLEFQCVFDGTQRRETGKRQSSGIDV